jgi:inosine-uridine nucleoside N-ribohydrolase
MSEDGDRVDPVLDGLDTFKTVVWLDCDPGHDDAMAIILAGWSTTVQLIGISTVASNQTVEKVTRNALDVLEVAGLSHIGVQY